MRPLNRFTIDRPRRAGFTLIEVMAAIFLTSMVITFAVSFYINLANISQAAIIRTRQTLQATSAIERVARDLASTAFIVKSEETDPLAHPWAFVAESRFAFDGSDLIRFNSRSKSPGEGAYHDSDLLQIVYQAIDEEDGSLTLLRWSSPGLPTGQFADYPGVDDDRNFVVAEGLGSFSLRFLDDNAQWLPAWDSSQLENSSELPVGVEIDVSVWQGESEDGWSDNTDDAQHFVKRVYLYQRPLDLNEMIRERDEAEAKDKADSLTVGGQGKRAESSEGENNPQNADESFGGEVASQGSVAECVRNNWALCVERYGEGNCGVWSNVTSVPLGAFGIDIPWCQ